MTINSIKRLFQNYSCAVFGSKGTGKDVLMGNVIARRKLPYVSNTNFGYKYIPYDTKKIACGDNTYKNFIEGNIKPYRFPYEDFTDLYIADIGVYFPSQYCNELNRDYKNIPVFEALSRHLGCSKLHYNTQNLARAWDKIREQCDMYIKCLSCNVLFGGKVVIQRVRIYEKYSSAVEGALPWRIKLPLFMSKEMRLQWKLAKQKYDNQYGYITERTLIYWNKSKHDTRAFKRMLEGDLNEKEIC